MSNIADHIDEHYTPSWFLDFINENKPIIVKWLLTSFIQNFNYFRLVLIRLMKLKLDWPELDVMYKSYQNILHNKEQFHESLKKYQPSELEMLEILGNIISHHRWNDLAYTIQTSNIRNITQCPKLITYLDNNSTSMIDYLEWCRNQYINFYAYGILGILCGLSIAGYIPEWLKNYSTKHKDAIIYSAVMHIKHDNLNNMSLFYNYITSSLKILKWPELKIIQTSLKHERFGDIS